MKGERQVAVSILGDEAIGSIIASYLSFGVISALFEALFQHKYPETLDRIQTLTRIISRAQSIERERNQFIHASWAIQPGGRRYERRKYTRGSPVPRREEVTAAEMEGFASTIRALTAEVESFIEGIPAANSGEIDAR